MSLVQQLIDAAERGDRKAVRDLVNTRGVNVDGLGRAKVGWDGCTALIAACWAQQAEVANDLLSLGADATIRSGSGYSALLCASAAGLTAVCKRLIDEHGADVNVRDHDGGTPLHGAARFGHAEVVSLLLSRGADVRLRKTDGKTPRDRAAENNHVSCVKLLQDAEAPAPAFMVMQLTQRMEALSQRMDAVVRSNEGTAARVATLVDSVERLHASFAPVPRVVADPVAAAAAARAEGAGSNNPTV